MTERYLLILILYAAASFGSVLLLLEGARYLLRAPMIRWLSRMRPSDAIFAHLLFRILPPTLAMLLTACSALPGYLHGEPIGTHELPGPGLFVLALVGFASGYLPVFGAVSLLVRTHLRTASWLRNAIGEETFSDVPVVELSLDQPLVVAAGLIRKRIFFSQVLRELLSQREFRAVLRHEAAHCHHHHNFARLLWTLAPHILPASALEASFREVIEYAADDAASAVPGDALNLASAVVVLARRSMAMPSVLYSSLIQRDNALLARRVERLIAPRPPYLPRLVLRLTVCSGMLLSLTALLASHPVAQHVFRESLEQLVH